MGQVDPSLGQAEQSLDRAETRSDRAFSGPLKPGPSQSLERFDPGLVLAWAPS